MHYDKIPYYSLYCRDLDEDLKDNMDKYKVVTCTGRQEESKVFVFGPTLHFTDKGKQIPLQDQCYVWVPQFLAKTHTIVNTLPPQLPPINKPLQFVVRGLQSIAGDNALSGVFLLSEIACLCVLDLAMYFA